MWNHSSTSTVIAFARGRGLDAPVDRTFTRASWCAVMKSAMESTDRSTSLPVSSSVIATPKRPLDLEDELEHVDGVEPEALAEERHAVLDRFRRDRQAQAPDNRPLDLFFQVSPTDQT